MNATNKGLVKTMDLLFAATFMIDFSHFLIIRLTFYCLYLSIYTLYLHFTPQLGQVQVTSAFTRRPCAPSTLPTATNSKTMPSGTKCPVPYFADPSIRFEHAWHFTRNRIVSAMPRDYQKARLIVKHYSDSCQDYMLRKSSYT